MRIGIPREIKNREHRVALTPDGARALISRGHRVLIEAGAGQDSGFDDKIYREAGAEIVDAASAWAADLVVKVKEPLASEYPYLRPGLMLFTYLHLAAVPELARELIRHRVLAIGYETVQEDDGSLPLLAPMSRVAGRLAVQLGVRFLQRENGTPFPGLGRLPGGIAHVPACHVLILGGGNVGQHAASAAAGLGARVTLLEADPGRIAELRKAFPAVEVHAYDHARLRRLLADTQLLIGAALIPGAHAPRLLSIEDVGLMQAGSVFVDVAIDQGGISESSRPTSFEEPVYVEQGVLHCCLPNLPAAVPATSTMALTGATLPYVLDLADAGADGIAAHAPLQRGINTRDGRVVHAAVAESLGFDA